MRSTPRYVKAELARVQEEYEAKRKAKVRYVGHKGKAYRSKHRQVRPTEHWSAKIYCLASRKKYTGK